MFTTIAAATVGLIISLNGRNPQASQQTLGAKESTSQSGAETAFESHGRETGQGSVPKEGRSALFPPYPAPNHAALPTNPQPNVPGISATQPRQAFSEASPATSLSPTTPQEGVTSAESTPQEPSVNGDTPGVPAGAQPDQTVGIPPQFQAKIVKNIKPLGQEKVIALTFDDGPWPRITPKVLEILKKNNIKATFFWVGQPLKQNPQIAKQVVAEGHVIGNHTWHHWYHRLDASTAAHEIEDTAELIYKTTGVRTSLFRPPGGVMNNGVADYAKRKNDLIVMWSNDPMDYRPHSAKQLVNNVIRKAQPGGIVLMHDGGGNHWATVEALPEIIAKLREQGYKFVTIPELLEMSDPHEPEVVAKKQPADSPPLFPSKP
jgi:peptidoglycan/xylan/chitin deacetylase (PgdA/CDA1 family)